MDTIIASEGATVFFGSPEKNIEDSLAKIKESADYLVQRNRELNEQLSQYDEKAGIEAKEDEIRSIFRRSISVLSPVEHERDKALQTQLAGKNFSEKFEKLLDNNNVSNYNR